jgi:hypothetical protein
MGSNRIHEKRFDPLFNVRYVSVAEVQHMNHLAAPFYSEPAVQIRFSNSQIERLLSREQRTINYYFLLSDELLLPANSGHSTAIKNPARGGAL